MVVEGKVDRAILRADADHHVIVRVDGCEIVVAESEGLPRAAGKRTPADPEQQKRLQEEFKVLLVRTYSGALAQVQDQTVELKPMRGSVDDKEVVVKTEIRGRGDPVQLDYRLEQAAGVWKIYDVNVMGIWLVENYRNTFSQEIGANGIDGLIGKLAERNKAAKG